MTEYIKKDDLFVDKDLLSFIETEFSSIIYNDISDFWLKIKNIINELEPTRHNLLQKRKDLQSKINSWHKDTKNGFFEKSEYKKFLLDIGYLIPEGKDFSINTENIDDEISLIAGPQLVVPILNARYALNAANARWGSLYDALYGTNVIPESKNLAKSSVYNENRGIEVIKRSKAILDNFAPLSEGNHSKVLKIKILENKLVFDFDDKSNIGLLNPNQFVGYIGKPESLEEVILKKNNLHIRIQIDKNLTIGKEDKSKIKDIIIESAISVIMDCEDSVVAVDTTDKINAFRNWLGLMNGNLTEEISKNGKVFKRKLNNKISYTNTNGKKCSLKGIALLLIRNVGHLMPTPSILNQNKNEIGEGFLDCLLTCLCSIKDLEKSSNSQHKSIYIVKPKMHGPEEVKHTVKIFSLIEELLNLPQKTLKIGIMDEERRTTLNLKECIRTAKDRVFFINTGFLDRTGDEIHTSMEAGPMVRKTEMKKENWIKNYEKWNVEIGLKCGFLGKAQIGKGMWAMPDQMAEMLEEKIQHCESGASTAWVPSPTAATLHALHYHKVNVFDQQRKLSLLSGTKIDTLLDIPIVDRPNWRPEEIQNELENNIQGILGYVVKWINNGIGCSKVPDINNIGLMEDRATLRISSQHIANWLNHNICSQEQVFKTFKEMAFIVDKQNKHDPEYIAMSPNFDKSIAFQTACDLVFKGKDQPSGYTEPILHKNRLKFKKSVVT